MGSSRFLVSAALLLGGCQLLWNPFQSENPDFCNPADPSCTNANQDGGVDAAVADAAMEAPDATAAVDGSALVDAAAGDSAQGPDLLCNPGSASPWIADPIPPGADKVTLTGITGNGNGDIWTVGNNPTYAAHHVTGWSSIDVFGVGSFGRAAYSPKQNQALALATNLVGVSSVVHLPSSGEITRDLVNAFPGIPNGIWVSGFPERLPYVAGADRTFKSYDGVFWSDVVLFGTAPDVLNDIMGSGMGAATIVWGVSTAASSFAAFSGSTWQTVKTTPSLNAVWVSPVSGVVVVGQNGTIQSAPATLPIKVPSVMASPVAANLTDVAGTADGTHLWAVGAGGTIVHWESTCRKWTQETSPTSNELKALWVSDAEKRVWAVGTSGTVVSRAIP